METDSSCSFKNLRIFAYCAIFFLMSEVKAVLSDLDGTLVLPDGHISEQVCAAVDELSARGVALLPVSGRDYHDIGELISPLNLRGLGVFSGGAAIVDLAKDKTIIEHSLPQETITAVVDRIMPYSISIGYGKGRRPVAEIDLKDIDRPARSIWALLERSDLATVLFELAKIPDIEVHANQGPVADEIVGLHITPVEINKRSGAKYVLDLLGVSVKNVLAIGDADNDLPLFECAAIKVAMGNASDLLKQSSDYVVSDVKGDGFVEAVNQFTLRKKDILSL